MCPAGERTAASDRSTLRVPKHPPPSGPLASEGDDNTKVLHTGGWACILWVSEQRPKQQPRVIQTGLPTYPRFPLHFLWYQQTERWNTGEFLWTANLKCTYRFPPLSQRGLPKPLLRNDGFTRLCLHFDARQISISGGRNAQSIGFSRNTTL